MAKLSNRVKLVRDIGESGVDDISRLVTRDPYASIIELCANSYDADASKCGVRYDLKTDTLSIVDDGEGMVPGDLLNFYTIGDSPKRTSPVSPGGRRRIGKFGVATIVIPNLCTSYDLVTRKNGLETSVQEIFQGMLRRGKEIQYEGPKRVAKDVHGTEIHLHGLKFGDWSGFYLNEMFNRLQWEFQLPPDFEMSLNGKPIEPKEISHADSFAINEDFIDGSLHGTMFLLRRASDYNGVHVYVNGRRVGDPSSFVNYSKLSGPARRKVLGIIHANPLERAILFDRGRFDESSPDVASFRKRVDGWNNRVALMARRRSEQTRKQTIESNIPSALGRIAEYFYRSKVFEFRAATEIVISGDFRDGELGVVDTDAARIMLNSNHPALVVPSGELKLPFQSRPHYEAGMIAAVVDVLALNRAMTKGKVNLDTYSKEKGKIWSKLKKIS